MNHCFLSMELYIKYEINDYNSTKYLKFIQMNVIGR